MAEATPGGPGQIDFFVSRRGSAEQIAREVVAILEGAGFTTRFQDRDIKPGNDFYLKMHEFLGQCRDFVAILTTDYFDDDGYTKAEWSSFKTLAHKAGGSRRLIPLRFDNFEPGGMAANDVFIDLVGVRSKVQRRKLILAAAKGDELPPRPAPPAKLYRVPAQDKAFTGRSELLKKLRRTFARQKEPAAISIQGMGGVGKTSLAAEFAHQHQEQYAGVWWAVAESRTMLLESLAELDGVLDGRPLNEQRPNLKPEELAKSALRKLASRSDQWLLVYDNAEKPGDIADLVPHAGAHLLITTRHTPWTRIAFDFPLDTLEQLEATRLLLKLTDRDDRAGAVRLTKAVGYLPLALDQAAAYVRLSDMTFDRYADRVDKLIAKDRADGQRNVAATFTLAIERAAEDCPAALSLLAFASMLAAEQIPRDLLDGSVLAEDDRDDALAALAAVSLVRYGSLDDGQPALSVHRLVQLSMRRRLSQQEFAEALVKAITVLAAAYPKEGLNDPKTWPRCKQLLPHALAIRDLADQAKIESVELARLMVHVGNYFLGRSAFADAEGLLKGAVQIADRLLGPEHELTGEWLHDLGSVYLNSGRYEQAKEKYFRAVSIGVQTLGRDHPQTARRIGNLAYALMQTGQHAHAEAYFREAIAIANKAYGRKHWRVAIRLAKFANFLHKMKRYEESEALFREAVTIGQETLGPENILVCGWVSEFADLLRDAGRHDEAERLYHDAIKTMDATVGDDHPSTSFSRAGLAELLLRDGRLEEARNEASRAVAGHKRLFGADHRWTRESADVLERVLTALGQSAQADALRREHRLERAQAKTG